MQETPLDPIIKNKRHFGSLQTLEEEHEEALKKFPYMEDSEKEARRQKLTQLGLVHVGPDPIQQAVPAKHRDPFTCCIQETLATLTFGKNIPREKPNPETSPPELVRDVEFFHIAAQRSHHFETKLVQPRQEKVFALLDGLFEDGTVMKALHTAIRKYPEMTVEDITEPEPPSSFGDVPVGDVPVGDVPVRDASKQSVWKSVWSGQPLPEADRVFFVLADENGDGVCSVVVSHLEAEMLAVLHQLYHFKEYIRQSIVDTVQASDTRGKNFVQLWEHLTGEWAYKPVRQWDVLALGEFTDRVGYLFKAWLKTAELLKEIGQ